MFGDVRIGSAQAEPEVGHGTPVVPFSHPSARRVSLSGQARDRPRHIRSTPSFREDSIHASSPRRSGGTNHCLAWWDPSSRIVEPTIPIDTLYTVERCAPVGSNQQPRQRTPSDDRSRTGSAYSQGRRYWNRWSKIRVCSSRRTRARRRQTAGSLRSRPGPGGKIVDRLDLLPLLPTLILHPQPLDEVPFVLLGHCIYELIEQKQADCTVPCRAPTSRQSHH